MTKCLLLGAGFSRNWGGWLGSEVFEYLIGATEVLASDRLKSLLWRHQAKGGFENAISELQDEATRTGDAQDLDLLIAAVAEMFNRMNAGLIEQLDPSSASVQELTAVRRFLRKFDAIFTLNQDVLLEALYLDRFQYDMSLEVSSGWGSAYLPGMKCHYGTAPSVVHWGVDVHEPMDSLVLDSSSQPVFKLHGSVNWRERGSTLLIIGGMKRSAIDKSPLLRWYSEQFASFLSHSNSRLMIVGYGFRDEHINQVISHSVDRGLRLFVNSPDGTDQAVQMNETRRHGQIVVTTGLEALFEKGVIGGSKRLIRPTVVGDPVEMSKWNRFLNGL